MGSKGGGSKQTTSTSSSEPPAWLQGAMKDVLAKGNQVYNLPLQQYGGPTLAGFTPDQQAAFQSIRDANGSWDPFMNSASGMVGAGTQDLWGQLPEFNQQNLQTYQDPYQEDVINRAMEAMRRSDAMQQEDLTGNAIMAGAFGGSGALDARNNLAGEQSRARGQTIADLYSKGYESAADKFMNQQQAQLGALSQTQGNNLQGAGIMGSLGSQNLQNILAQGGAQLSGGTQQQGLVQEQLNIPYQQFLQQQAYPYEQLQYYANLMNSIVGGAGGTSTTTGTAPGQKSNVAGDVIGLGMTAASLFSDRRVKDDVKKVGKLDNGLPVYSYKYKGDDTTQIGLMAQDVKKKNPAAVGEVGGIMTVNYDAATKEKANGGRVKGGIAALEPYARSNANGFVSARLSAPAPVAPPQAEEEEAGLDIGGILGAMGGINGSGAGAARAGMRGIIGNKAMHGVQQQTRGRMGYYGPGFADGGVVAEPVQGFKPVVEGTPVYGFDPNVTKSGGVVVPTAHDQILANLKAEAAKAPVAESPKYKINMLNFMKALGDGEKGSAYWLASGVAQDANGNLINPYSKQPIAGNHMDALKQFDLAYADGGVVGKPRVLAAEPIQNQTMNPEIPAMADMGKSYIPAGEFQNATLSAPNTGKMSPAPWSPDFEGTPQGEQNILDRALDTPWRAGLLGAGAGMMANNGESVLDDLAAGIKSGVSAYAGVKSAKAAAQKLEDAAEKARLDLDMRLEDHELKREEFGLRRDEIKARTERDSQPDYDVKEGEDQFYKFDKKTGVASPAGGKPKKAGRAALDVSPADIKGIEDAALSNVPGAISGYDQYNRPIMDDEFLSTIGPKRMQARTAASEVYQDTRDAAAAQQVYLETLGVDPSTDAFEPGTTKTNLGNILPGGKPFREKVPAKIKKDPAALLGEAQAAIAAGADRGKVIERLKSMGVDAKGL